MDRTPAIPPIHETGPFKRITKASGYLVLAVFPVGLILFALGLREFFNGAEGAGLFLAQGSFLMVLSVVSFAMSRRGRKQGAG